ERPAREEGRVRADRRRAARARLAGRLPARARRGARLRAAGEQSRGVRRDRALPRDASGRAQPGRRLAGGDAQARGDHGGFGDGPAARRARRAAGGGRLERRALSGAPGGVDGGGFRAPAPIDRGSVEVEQLVEERLAFAVTAALAIVPLVAIALVRIAPVVLAAAPAGRFGLRRAACRALDDLVELAAIEPDAAAFRAVVDLDALPVRHQQFRLVYRAFHPRLLLETVSPHCTGRRTCAPKRM